MPGKLIANRFEIQNLLGRGGMGEVYRAKDIQSGETVAVKALNPDVLSNDPTLLERFAREGEALRQLNHPNIVHMVSAVEEDGRHYLVMEFVEGGSLRDLLTALGCLPASEVVKIALEVADALTRAHHLKIIHRDLKPGNILLARDGTPRLADFGIAHVQESSHLTQTGILVGTVDYLSPEVCQGEPPDELSDIWAFGVMLFEMLSGKLPFEGKSMTAKITAILHQPVPDLKQLTPDIPEALIDLIYRMLEKDSRQRIPSVRLVAAELEGIQKGRDKTTRTSSASGLPAFLEKGEDVKPPVFVTRENELAQLDHFLGHSLEGHGQVAFITGDPGQGKTALAQEFARQAREKYPELVIANGNCNAYTGIGDPYLPFREILWLLCGDIESRWEARAISREQARRLWQCIPLTVQALVESGCDLVGIFVPGEPLVKRVSTFSPWSGRGEWFPKLEQLVQHKATTPIDPSFQQAALFEQYTRVLRAIAHEKPLLLILDDLQWADSGSINLLFHLGKGIEGSRVMILGTYRTTELALRREGQRHPLEPILNEFKRQYGNIQVEVGKRDGRRFVDAFVDSEPNHLGEDFRATLFSVSGGHPLGTIELLRDLQERGGLVLNPQGEWVEGKAMDWNALPARLEAMIAERIERLDPVERRVLKVASVEGETFTAEVIAQVLEEEPQTILNLLSEELDKRHRLVSALNIRQQNGRRLSIYRFQHILFQRYLHGNLDVVECSNLHQSVGNALTELYADGLEEISGQLARHFQEAGTNTQAGDYLVQAGDRARDLYAYQEAVNHYQQAQVVYQRALGEKWEPRQKAELEYRIAQALYRKGEYYNSMEHIRKALGHLGIPFPVGKTRTRLEIVFEIIRHLFHRIFLRNSLINIDQPASPRLVAAVQLYSVIGWIEILGNPENLLLAALKGLNLSEAGGFHPGYVAGAGSFGTVLDFFGIFRFSRHYHQAATAVAENIQDPLSMGTAYACIANHHGCLGNLELSTRDAMVGASAFEKAGDRNKQSFSEHILADYLYYQGRFAESLQVSRKILERGIDRIDPQIQCWGWMAQGAALRRSGEIGEAVKSLEETIRLADALPDYANRIEAGGELGRSYLRQGWLADTDAILRTTYQVYLEHIVSLGADVQLFNGLAESSLVHLERCSQEERGVWGKKARHACWEAVAHSHKFRPALPDALRMLGSFEWMYGRSASAQKYWEQALGLAEKQQQPYDAGTIHYEMGYRLHNLESLKAAENLFVEVGAKWDLACTQEALKKG